ncbi:hypothetical protein SBADM41S_06941 [Streptomyces badius]
MTETLPCERQRTFALAERLAARCSVTRDEEHAVSTVTAGPSIPRWYESLPDSGPEDP